MRLFTAILISLVAGFRRQLALVAVFGAATLMHAVPAYGYGSTECAASRFGANLNCTANDVSITGISLAPGSETSCEGGSNITLNLNLTVNFASPDRYDVGIFVANDGNSPQRVPASGGANSCSVAILPTTSPFLNLNANTCGDGNNGINGGTGSGQIVMNNVTVPCQTTSTSAGKLYIPFVVSWAQNAGSICNSIDDPVPGTTSKCNAPSGTDSTVDIVVMPSITKTDGLATINAGSSTSYTIVVANNTGVSSTGVVLKDPAVSGLTVSSVTCSASGGATCPSLGGGAVGSLQGSGISLPSIPNGGTLTFTLNGTVNNTAGGTLTNTASITMSGQTRSAADSTTVIPRADLAITKTRSASLVPGANASYTLTVSSSGPGTETGPITVTDTLPTGLTYVSASGTGWTCGASGQVVTCTRSGTLASGASASAITLTVAVASNASGTITNSATVAGSGYDPSSANNTATNSYTFPSAYAYYAMDEVIWTGAANEVADSSGNNRHANRAGTTTTTNQTTTFGHDCRGAVIDANTSLATAGAQTPVNINSLGNAGTIAFWYYNNVAWNSAGVANYRTLLDASSNAFGQFWLVLQPDGSLQFAVSDGFFGWTNTLTGNTHNFAANTWHHIAISWNFASGTLNIYIDGALDDTGSSFLLLFPSVYDTLLVGDSQIVAWSNLGNSANGIIDEVRIYNGALSTADVAAVMSYTHGCPAVAGPNHIRIEHTGSALTCTPQSVTVKACADATCSSLYASGANVTLQPGGAVVTIGASGTATGTVQQTTVGTATLSATSAPAATGSPATVCKIGATDDCSMAFADSGFLISVPNHASETSQSLTLSAVKKSDNSLACTPAFANVTRSVTLTCSYANPNSGTLPVRVTNASDAWTPLGASASSVCAGGGVTLTMKFDANGTATDSAGNGKPALLYADVGQMNLAASYAGSAGTNDSGLSMTGSTSFVVAPASFGFAAFAAGATIKAGADFGATITARNNAGSAVPNFGREAAPEGVTLSANLVAPAGGANPNLDAATKVIAGSAFGGTGVASPANLRWGEVGEITLTANLTSGSYLGSGITATGTSGSVGRFYPDHFDTEVTDGCATCGFTYSKQAFFATVRARNVAGTTTTNYDSALGYSRAVNLAARNADGTSAIAASVGTLANTSLAATAFAAGVASTPSAASNSTTPLVFAFADPRTEPTIVRIRATEAAGGDNVTSSTVEGQTEIRSGRFTISNVHGSELLAAPVDVTLQYYKNGGFITNPDDDATALLVATGGGTSTMLFNGFTAPLNAAGISVVGTPVSLVFKPSALGNGKARFTFGKPASSGAVRMSVPVVTDVSCTTTLPTPLGCYLASGYAIARFGVYKGSNQYIYIRELY